METEARQFIRSDNPLYLSKGLNDDSGDTTWRALLSLDIYSAAKQSIVKVRDQLGPLRIQKALYPELDGTAHIYVLHPPGGLVSGDNIECAVRVNENARTLVTTPGAGKFYRSNGKQAHSLFRVVAEENSWVEWFPQETIFFSGSNAIQKTRVDLRSGANFIGWDILCLGRPAADERFIAGSVRNRFELWRENVPVFIEAGRISDDDDLLSAMYGWQDFSVSGTLIATINDERVVERLRQQINAYGVDQCAATLANGIVVCRYLGQSAAEAKEFFIRCWEILRPAMAGKEVVLPRIWKT